MRRDERKCGCRWGVRVLAGVVVWLLAARAAAQAQTTKVWPGASWQGATPAQVGVDKA